MAIKTTPRGDSTAIQKYKTTKGIKYMPYPGGPLQKQANIKKEFKAGYG